VGKRKVLVLGGGLSALSAGIHLLQEGGGEAFDVTLVCMEHRLGGKAASWRLRDGRYMEVGFHAIFGYYRALRTLLERAGHPVDDPRWFSSNEGEHLMYEASARSVNRLDIPSGPLDVAAFFDGGFVSYQGMSFTEKLAAAKWLARTGARLLLEEIRPGLDEHSFTAYCVGTGLDVELTQKSWFRYVLDLAFNYPHEGSAYVGMYGFQRLMGPDESTVHYLNGPLSEVIVRPIVDLYLSLGGKIEFCTKATRIELDPVGRRLEKIVTQAMAVPTPVAGHSDHVAWSPIADSYALDENPYPTGDPAPPMGSAPHELRRGVDFDDVVWTLPIDSTRALLRTTPSFERAVLENDSLRRIWSLRTVASISLRVWLPRKVLPPTFTTVLMGTPQPCATIIDYANRVDELRNGRWGSVIEFEGQEGLHAGLDDVQIVRELLGNFAELPFVNRSELDIEKIIARADGHDHLFRRNTAHHMRYLLMEPGHWKFRPDQHDRPFENLTFAGDWMQGTQPTASMEAAVRNGRVAADILRADAGLNLAEA
jgi:Flavin containing amine oxidoreductase